MQADRGPQRRAPWLTSVSAALVVGLINTVLTISFAALLFAGELSAFLAEGIGLALLSTMVSGIVLGLLSSLRGMSASVPAASTAVLATAAATAVAAMPPGAAPRDVFVTVVVANGITAFVTGAFLLGVGGFRLGRLVRFMPYPVAGGFLAGMGWVLFAGSFSVMGDLSLAWGALPTLLEPDALLRWVPGIAYGFFVLIAAPRIKHELFWPALLVVPVAGFYALMLATGATVDGWREAGFLFGAFPEAGLWTLFDIAELARVEWSVVLGYAPSIVAMCFIVVISILFKTTAVELMTNRDLDLDQELRAAGLANVLIGAFGGVLGYHMLGTTAAAQQIGRGRRRDVLASVAVVALALAFGSFLSYLPRFLIGGFLAYVGLMFLRDWLLDTFRRLTAIEYAIVVLIMVVIGAVGFLEGVAVGVLATVVLFVVDYGRSEVVKHERDGRAMRSRVSRDAAARTVLDAHGDATWALELQGFVFFGSADRLVDRVRARLESVPSTRFVILDFRHVTGIDATAQLAFEKLGRVAAAHEVTLVLSAPAPDVAQKLQPLRDDPSLGAAVETHATLDAALEACEARLLAAHDAGGHDEGLAGFLGDRLGDPEDAAAVLGYFEPVDFEAGEELVRQGDAPDALYFVDAGRVTALLLRDGAPPLRFETMAGGSLIGELGFYTGGARTASVVADEATSAHRLTRAAVDRMTAEAPELAAAFHALVVRLLAERTAHLMRVVDALQR